MILKLTIFPDKLLRQKSEPVVINDENDLAHMQSFLDSMVETCRHIHGIGLSAVQVGIPSRMFVVVTEEEELHFINPEIVEVSPNEVMMREGCLSFPGVFADVTRPALVKIKYKDYNFQDQELEAYGIVGRCILHEYDHLEGRVFSDLLKPVARDMVNRKSKKAKKMIDRHVARQAAAGDMIT